MPRISNLAKELFTTGLRPDQNFQEKRDIIFTNHAAVVLIMIGLGISTSLVYVAYFERATLAFLLAVSLMSIIPLQAKEKYFAAKLLAVALPFTAIALSTILFGPKALIQFYLIATLTFSLLIFHRMKQHLVSLLLHSVALIGLVLYSEKMTPVFPGQDSEGIGIFNIGFCLLCIFVTLRQSTLHNEKYESKIIQLLDSIQKQNEMLEEQKSFIDAQRLEMQHYNLELQKEIKEREAAQQQLLASNEELEQFAYVASHDLKEPLRTVGSFTGLIQRRLGGQLDGELSEYFQFVVGGVKRMTGLLDDLLALSRLKKDTEFSSVDLEHLLHAVCINLKSSLTDNEGEVAVSEMPTIMANRAQLMQLFQNLLSNSLKFRSEEAPRIEINCEEKADKFLFKVQDNGIGIPSEYQEKVFVIFQRLQKTAGCEGSGIGLAICRKIVQNHGGDIWLESEEGKGTTFYFTILKKLDDTFVQPKSIMMAA